MILFISKGDHAGVGWRFQQALRSVGVEALSIVQNTRPAFNPYGDAQVFQDEPKYFLRCVNRAKVIVWMHSTYTPVPIDVRKIKTAVFHGGSAYRNDPGKMNTIFNDRVDLSLIQTPNLLGLGAKNEHLIIPPIDEVDLKPVYRRYRVDKSKLVIGHYPTRTYVKGSHEICRAVWKLAQGSEYRRKFEFRISSEIFPYVQHLERMKKCDVIIDQVALSWRKKPLGFWGMTALEAGALGKIVICSNDYAKEYEKTYGTKCGFITANNCPELVEVLKGMVRQSFRGINRQQRRVRHWVETYHGLKPTGKRLKELLLER